MRRICKCSPLLTTLTDQCFALLVRSTGVPTRWVWNSEDHVWVEYFSTRYHRWIHLDPCENAYDDPLLYARNWRKKMAYCIAFDEFGAMDVTRRYVRRPHEEGITRNRVKERHVDLVDTLYPRSNYRLCRSFAISAARHSR
jgi:hypothetical protein